MTSSSHYCYYYYYYYYYYYSHQEQVRQHERRVEKYKELLADYYYRSDHVGIDWDEAKDELGG